jgi:hypothetical protein
LSELAGNFSRFVGGNASRHSQNYGFVTKHYCSSFIS